MHHTLLQQDYKESEYILLHTNIPFISILPYKRNEERITLAGHGYRHDVS